MKQSPLHSPKRHARTNLPLHEALVYSDVFGSSTDQSPLILDGRRSKDEQKRAIEMHMLLKDKEAPYDNDTWGHFYDDSSGRYYMYYLFEKNIRLIFRLDDLTMRGDFWAIYQRTSSGSYSLGCSGEFNAKLRTYLNDLLASNRAGFRK